MRRIRSTGMKPEMAVRKMTHRMGYRYRLHVSNLPGKPDLVFPARRKVIFVHGCFWHQHPSRTCRIVRVPKSNLNYWSPKLKRNVERDRQNQAKLRSLGWGVLVIWECSLKNERRLETRLRSFLGNLKPRRELATHPSILSNLAARTHDRQFEVSCSSSCNLRDCGRLAGYAAFPA